MKKIVIFFIFTLSCVSTLLSQTSTGFETLDYLYSISGKKTLAGQHDRSYWFTMKQIAGDYPALWGEDFMYQTTGGASSMAEWRQEITNDAKQHWLQGAVVALMFHACPPTSTSQTCNWWANNQGTCTGCIHSALTSAQWTQLLTDGSSLNNAWKARLDEIYPYLKQLQDAGVEVLFRLFHEMNQPFFWWAGQGANTANLYKLSHDYLVKTKGLTNLIWVWNVQDFSTLATDLNDYDPGNDYWDVLALDVYNSDGAGYTQSKYNAMVAKANGKPIAIGECQTLPNVGSLSLQPKWTYFMGWSSLVQQNNSDATIKSIYNNATYVLTLKNGRAPLVSDDQDALTVCNFDNVFPYVAPSTPKLTLDIAEVPDDSPVSGKMGVFGVPANNSSGFFTVYLNEPIDPRNYVGISLLAQANSASPWFVIKLQESSDTGNTYQIQDYNTHSAYTGNGAWQEVQIPFDVLLGSASKQLGYVLNQYPDFLPSYDELIISPAANQSIPAFTVNIDNIRLRTSWAENGIPLTKVASLIITSANGTISAKAATGDPVSLKVYSISGQEIVAGMNQVQVGTKGVYIVNATAGNITDTQKVVVQ